MKFKVRRIKPRRSGKKWLRRLLPIASKKFWVILFALIFIAGSYGCVRWIGSNKAAFVRLIPFGDLEQDRWGHTNVLLLGVAGKAEEGGHLSDSIMIASINPKGPSVSFLSLPRDLFIGSAIGDRKVNEIYAAAQYKHGPEKGLKIIKDAIADFTGVPIHYGAVVNFQVFEDVVDSLGGLDIFVLNDIVDPFYPDENYGYKTFVVRRGWQHFDGETALQYARSRKTTSDYDRAQRQQQILMALKNQAQEFSLLSDFDKLKDFYKVFKKNVVTDVGVSQIIALAKIGISLDYDTAVHAVLNDDPTQKGGFLYTPAKEFFGGQFVLLPEDLKDTQMFIQLVLEEPDILLENAQIEVLNGSSISGKAGEMASRLRRMGFHVIEVGNHESDRPVFMSFLEELNVGSAPKTLKFLSRFFEADIRNPQEEIGAVTPLGTESLVDIRFVLGIN